MKWKQPFEKRIGRLYIQLSWRDLSFPRFYIYPGEKEITVGFSYGHDGSDQAVMLDYDFPYMSRAGRLIEKCYWKLHRK